MVTSPRTSQAAEADAHTPAAALEVLHDTRAVGAFTKKCKRVELTTSFGVGLMAAVVDGRQLRMDSTFTVAILTPCCGANAEYKPKGNLPGRAWHNKEPRGYWRCRGCKQKTLPELEEMDEIWHADPGQDPLLLSPKVFLWRTALERFAVEYGGLDILRAAMLVQDCLGQVEEELFRPWTANLKESRALTI